MSDLDPKNSSLSRRRSLQKRGLYAITDTRLCAQHGFANSVEAALQGGAVIVQYRDKSTDAGRRESEANTLVELCARYDALSIINDDAVLAQVSCRRIPTIQTPICFARVFLRAEYLIERLLHGDDVEGFQLPQEVFRD